MKTPVYVVTFTKSGKPVLSENKDAMLGKTGFVPQLWEDWVEGSIEEKLAVYNRPEGKTHVRVWLECGNDVESWVISWIENGWLQKEVNPIENPERELLEINN